MPPPPTCIAQHAPRAVASALLLWLAQGASAQSIADLHLSRAEVKVSEEVVIGVDLRRAGSVIWCGLRIEVGDGSVRDLRVGLNGEADLSVRLPVRYPRSGSYTVRVSGVPLIRGLRSAAPCEGGARAVVLRAFDPSAPSLPPAAPPAPTAPVPPPAPAPPVVAAPGPAPQARPPEGMVGLPSFGRDSSTAPAVAHPGPAAPVATGPVVPLALPTGPLVPVPAHPPMPPVRAVAPPPGGNAAGTATPACRPGPEMEARDYAQPEYIGRPEGRVARMCFYRSDGRSTSDRLNFYPNGHVVIATSNATSGVGGGVSVLGTVRGTYGFQEGGRLAMRLAYVGTGVSHSARAPGAARQTDVTGQDRLERELTLPNCQRITVTDLLRSVQWPDSAGHPRYIVVDGVRWEEMSIDCPVWQGWR